MAAERPAGRRKFSTWSDFREGTNKSLMFGLLAAGGSLLGACVGELLLQATRIKQEPALRHAVCVILDTSSSMSGDKLIEVQQAASSYVDRQDLTNDRIAIVSFGDHAQVMAPFDSNTRQLESAVQGLVAQGSTALHLALRSATAELSRVDDGFDRGILLFTDGSPDSQDEALQDAEAARSVGIRIVAVATPDANRDNLIAIAGNSKQVVTTEAGSFGRAFESAEKILAPPPDVLDPTEGGMLLKVFRVGCWTGLCGVGIVCALQYGQSSYLRRDRVLRRQLIRAALTGVAAGFVAGGIAVVLFDTIASVFLQRNQETGAVTLSAWISSAERLSAWTLLGALLGCGMSPVIPNLRITRGLLGGAIGGAAGALVSGSIQFLLPATSAGGVLGAIVLAVARLAGAVALGFGIGAIVAVAEMAFRTAWLEVNYGSGESRIVNLGSEPITIGSNGQCTVYSRNAAHIAFRYRFADGRISIEDVPRGITQSVRPGDRRTAGTVTLTVCVKGSMAAAPASGEQAFRLRLSTGRSLTLHSGTRLTTQDLSGLETRLTDGLVAEVSYHPTTLGLVGLTNRGARPWIVGTADGGRRQIAEGQSISLQHGLKLDFGNLQGEIV